MVCSLYGTRQYYENGVKNRYKSVTWRYGQHRWKAQTNPLMHYKFNDCLNKHY
jgi:hypothetical protein